MRRVLCVLALLLAILPARAFEPDAATRGVDLPPDGSGPVPVQIEFFLLDVTAINDAAETFDASVYIDLKWKDSRMAFDAAKFGSDRALYPKDAADTQLAAMWSPHIDVENLVGEPSTLDQCLTIHADGAVEFEQRIAGTFSSAMKLSRFPFDQQKLAIRLESFMWTADELQFVGMDASSEVHQHVNERLSLNGWSFVASSQGVSVNGYPTGEKYSTFISRLIVHREPWFYMWSVVFPLVLVTIFALTCFFWDQEALGERVAQVLTCLLTVTAQSLVVSGDLPKISYFTPIDYAFLLTYAILLIVAVESIAMKFLNERNRALADHIDYHACWVLSLAYAVGMGAVFWR
jgi:hypothetical protein